MIHPANTSVEFEVSIGNYGNKLDTNTPVQPSTTLPSNPFYDGQNYYYLPWLEEKPCVVVESQWEDCSYRIISMNILLGVADRMVCVLNQELMSGKAASFAAHKLLVKLMHVWVA